MDMQVLAEKQKRTPDSAGDGVTGPLGCPNVDAGNHTGVLTRAASSLNH